MSIQSAVAGDPRVAANVLAPGQTHRIELHVDRPLAFDFSTEEGTVYLVEIDQGGLDLKVTVTSPGGTSKTFNSPLLRDESEAILLEPGAAGIYTITLESSEYSGAVANPAIRVGIVSPENGKDLERLAGLRLVSDAAAANHLGAMEGWHSALQSYDRALVHFGNADDEANLARTLFSIAIIEYWQMMNWDRSADLAAQAAGIYLGQGQGRLAANAIHLRAAAIIEKANEVEKSATGGLAPEAGALFDEAFSLFNEALEKQRDLGNPFDAALVINNIGLTHFYLGDWAEAAIYFGDAADQFRQLKEWGFELQALSNVNAVDVEQGNLVKGIKTARRILELLPAGKSNRFRADLLDNLGASLLTFGQLDEALQSFSTALSLHEELNDLKGQGRSLAGIGTTYYAIGERELALEMLESALNVRQEANDGRGQVAVLKFIGNIHRHDGDYRSAMEAHSAALQLVTSPIDKARARIHLARDFVAAGDPSKALEVLDQARNDVQDVNNRKLLADISKVSGDAWLKAGDHDRSFSAYQAAEAGFRSLGLDAEQSQAMFGLANAARQLGHHDRAIEYAEKAVASVEKLRLQLVTPEMRKFFLASRHQHYAFLIDLLMTPNGATGAIADEHVRKALSVSERSRARALVDLVTESVVRPASQSGSIAASKREQLLQQMAESRHRLDRLLETAGQPGIEKDLSTARQALAHIENELNLLQIEIRKKDPAYAGLVNPEILGAGQIQALLDSESALLQYFLGDEGSYAWLVTRGDIRAWRLAGREAIEDQARGLYERLKHPAFSSQERAELDAGIADLSLELLGPVTRLDKRRIIVAADGVLHYLPFAILEAQNGAGDLEPLLAGHEIIYLPSMSVLAAQRANRKEQAHPRGEIAIFADPVFEDSDSRFENAPLLSSDTGENPAGQASVQVESGRLARLPATSFEARAIAEMVNPERRLLATGFDASRESVLGANLGDYRTIHFATHGLIDSRYPALSALALSQFDERGKPLDGFLRLNDFYNLDLNADLVTMSACGTALGREIVGEGLTGLTQGLMHSGSRSVLASLWQVPDRATAELMQRFYRNMLTDGQRPAEALRNAQLELAATARWHSPYFWGAFALQGDWR